MKKIIILLSCFMLIFTNISFADQNTYTSISQQYIIDAINDIEEVNNRIYILIKQVTGDDPLDSDTMFKNIKLCESMLDSQSDKIVVLNSNISNKELKRKYSSLLHVISLYKLSLSSLSVYIEDDSKADFFIDTCSNYQSGNISLKAFKSNVKSREKLTNQKSCN